MSAGPITRDLIVRGAKAHRDTIAIQFGDETLTAGAANALANQIAHFLSANGKIRGDRVAILLDNGLYTVPLDFACVKAGLNRVPLNSRLSVGEHVQMIKGAGADLLIHGEPLSDHAEAICREAPEVDRLSLAHLVAEAARQPDVEPDVAVAPDDVILTIYTSGTTGSLKAAQHTQASYAGIARNVMLNVMDIQPGDTMAHAASLIHASGVFVLPFWLRGGRTLILPGFDPSTYLETLRDEGVTAINLVPTMLQMLMKRPDFDTLDLPKLRQVIYGASPMPRPVIEAAIRAWGRDRFWQYYGQTECPLAIALLRPEDHVGERLGACGRPAFDVEIRLVDEAGEDVADGEIGEIAVRAPAMMAGYHDAPQLNAETRLPGGWLRTRDVGQFDEDGFLYLRDRTSDMIITGGYNVYPREVEDVLTAHPDVSECAVIGVKDETWVEAVTAVVAAADGATVDESALIAFVGERLASYKKPRRVIVVDAIPKTAVGKTNRKALRDRFGK